MSKQLETKKFNIIYNSLKETGNNCYKSKKHIKIYMLKTTKH